MSSSPIYHYWDLGRLGRGEVVYLFLKDAGIEVQEKRYPYDEKRGAVSAKLVSEGVGRTGKLPAIEYKGKVLTQHIPTLRYFARELGSYDGETNDDKFIVDVVSDMYIDWRAEWVTQLGGKTDSYAKFVPQYYDIIAQYYSEKDGPYLLGDKVTYADFAVYQSIDNDERIGTLPATLPPAIQKFREAFEARPNIAAYIKQHKK